jgi:hypothetical protein
VFYNELLKIGDVRVVCVFVLKARWIEMRDMLEWWEGGVDCFRMERYHLASRSIAEESEALCSERLG